MNPDTDDGYTRIANELLEAIVSAPLSKREYKVVFAVIRKTYGFGKKSDDMTLSQLADLTHLDPGNLSKTVSDLVARKVLLKQQGRYGQVLGINKKYREWKGLLKRQRCQNDNGGCQNNNLLLLKQQSAVVKTTTTKETTKRNYQKKTPIVPKMSVEEAFASFWKSWPKKVGIDQARKTFAKIMAAKDPPDLQDIIDGVGRAIKLDRRFRTKQYTPHPSTWLNAGGWKDEHEPDDPGGGPGGQSATSDWQAESDRADIVEALDCGAIH